MIICVLELLLFQSGITQKELADELNIHKATINNYCRNNVKSINFEHLEAFCDYFKCTPNDIIKTMNKKEYKRYQLDIMTLRFNSFSSDEERPDILNHINPYKDDLNWNLENIIIEAKFKDIPTNFNKIKKNYLKTISSLTELGNVISEYENQINKKETEE